LNHPDQNPEELLACIRRGPFAAADESELIDYLLFRRRANRVQTEKYSVFHVLSYQRRLNFIKNEFFKRGATTPLGRMKDWWVLRLGHVSANTPQMH
jgi:hypothetical protein